MADLVVQDVVADTKDGDNINFDNPDALALLLQTITQNAPESDWTQVSAWTNPHDAKPPPDMNDFNFDFGMDLDFDPSMAVDPSALHFNTSMFTQPDNHHQYTDDNMAASIFALTQPWPQQSHPTGRRLSITSSSSSSGASLSPILEPHPALTSSASPTATGSSASSDCGDYPLTLQESDPAHELANRVRQSAGVTLAVPVSSQVQQLAAASTQNALNAHSPHLHIQQQKLAIPRIHKSPVKRSPSENSLRASPDTPSSDIAPSPSNTPPSSVPSPQPSSQVDTPPVVLGISGRPKTSHTTIERRYRTNLNARITGLKQAVPALRVLEIKNGAPSPWNDVVDERGFVDGVKVARKMSKANVLGKATEYIRVLKKREARLKREQDGLKSLISGLVGGPALLREWDREWKDKFGGEEKDEIEGDDLVGAADDDDDEDSDAEDQDGGPVRKKVKTVKKEKIVKPIAPIPQQTQQGQNPQAGMPEKRKRGRPRKVPLPPVASAPITMQPMEGAVSVSPSQHQQLQPQQQAQAQPQQYLLAAFAFFSVLNSPLASSFARSHHSHYTDNHSHSHAHAHHGQVLTTPPSSIPASTVNTMMDVPLRRTYGMHEFVQAFHLLVSVLVFVYVVLPWVRGVVRRWKSVVMVKKFNHPGGYRRMLLMDALANASRGSPDEASRLRRALGVKTGVVGLMQGVIKAARVDRGLEMNQLEQRAWVRLGELIAFDGSVSRATRLQTYWCMSWHVSTFATSTTDLTTLALIIYPVSPSKAHELWDRARNQDVLRPYERLALESLSVEDAADWLVKWQRFHDKERKGGRCAACEKRTPLALLAAILMRERLRRCAALLFVRSVMPFAGEGEGQDGEGGSEEGSSEGDVEEREEEERRQIVDAGKSIGGRTAELAILLEKSSANFSSSSSSVSTSPSSVYEEPEDIGIGCVEEHDLARSDEVEIRTLLTATEIYRQIFPIPLSPSPSAVSVILSPPPSPPSSLSGKKGRLGLGMIGTLRAALASGAFDFDTGRVKDERLGVRLEEARDRVCDMLTEVERSVRRNAGGRVFA